MANKNKIIVFEPNMNSFPHSEVNAGFLSLLELVYELEKLVFIADKNHFNAIQKIKRCERWNYIPTRVFSYEPKFFFLNDVILIFKVIRLLFSLNKTDTFYLLGIMPLAHIIISFFNSFLQKKCIICLHGQMEAFLEETKIGKSKYYYRLSKFVFKRNDAIDYLLFGESIKFSLLHLFDSRKKLIVIDQPYIYGELNKKLNSRRTIITLGLLGRFDQSKNVQQFFVFLDLILPEVIASKIHIKIVGRVNCEIPMQYLKYLSIYDRFLTKDEFENELSQLDFVISFTDKNFYKATPSGVFFDSIKWELPILSLKNSFLDYYFEVHGNLGMLFENTNDMVNYINRIVKDTVLLNEEKRTFKNNIKLLKSKLSIANISQNFKNQL